MKVKLVIITFLFCVVFITANYLAMNSWKSTYTESELKHKIDLIKQIKPTNQNDNLNRTTLLNLNKNCPCLDVSKIISKYDHHRTVINILNVYSLAKKIEKEVTLEECQNFVQEKIEKSGG